MGLKLSDKTKAVISKIAPTLGAALGGPLGAMAGNVISAAIGGGDDKSVEDALISQKPETLLALRTAEQEFLIKLEELGVDRDKIAADDRASARDLAKLNMKPQMMIAAAFVVGYFLTMGAILAGIVVIDGIGAQILPVLVGALTAGLQQILNFFFGSTVSSAQKTQMLYKSKPADSD